MAGCFERHRGFLYCLLGLRFVSVCCVNCLCMRVCYGGANPAARNLGNYRGTGEVVPFCTCGSLMAKWTFAFGAHLGLSHASRCLPFCFLHPKLGKIDAV